MSSDRDETQRAILDAARRLLEETPDDRVRLSDVAEEAGYSRQTIYLRFGSRSNLLVELVRYIDEVEELAKRTRPIWEATGGREALAEMVHLNAVYTPRIYPVAHIAVRDRYRDEDLAKAYEDRMEGRRRAYRRLILWLKRDGVLAAEWSEDVDAAVDVLFSLTSIQLWQVLVVDRGWSAERYEEHLRTIVERTFLEKR